MDKRTKRNKAIANEIVSVFKKLKTALLSGIFWFLGYAIYNVAFIYSIFHEPIFKGSLEFALIMILVTFGVLLLYHYIKKTIEWIKKYSD